MAVTVDFVLSFINRGTFCDGVGNHDNLCIDYV
jgi:hypothetical protein